MANDQVISIHVHMQKKLLVFVAINALLVFVIYQLIRLDSSTFSWLSSPLFFGLYGLFFVGTVVANLINRGKKIIFSVRDQCVYSQSVLGRKKLMAFADIGAIKPYSTNVVGTYLALFGRDNLFAINPVRVSPHYVNSTKGDQAFAEFQDRVLPKLWATSRESTPPPVNTQSPATGSSLVYYQRDSGCYKLKNVYGRNLQNNVYVVVLFGVTLLILSTPSLRLQYLNGAIAASLVALLLLFIQTESKQFRHGQLETEFTGGLFKNTYPLSQFITYEVIHRRYNFIYAGTDINLVFNVNNKRKSVFICQMRKTEKIDALLKETSSIIEQDV